MASINVDPEGLRDAGERMNKARETLIDQSNGNLLHGVGQDQHISTAGFWPGVWAQKQLTNRYNEAQQAFLNINNNFIAISSALYIVADVFQSTDQRDALEFAFLNPNAQRPSGLPAYMLDQDGNIRTSVEFRAQAEAEVALNGGGLPPGWTRRDRTTSPYSKVTELVDANGNVVAAMYTSSYLGETRVSYYRGDQLMSSRVTRTSANGTKEVTVYDGQNRRIRSMHEIQQENGSTTYYTNVYDPEHPDRDPNREDEITVGPETEGAQPGDDIVRQQRDSEFVARNRQMYQTAVDGPAEPENYDGAVNRITY
jgi:uncharacterized protein YukE